MRELNLYYFNFLQLFLNNFIIHSMVTAVDAGVQELQSWACGREESPVKNNPDRCDKTI